MIILLHSPSLLTRVAGKLSFLAFKVTTEHIYCLCSCMYENENSTNVLRLDLFPIILDGIATGSASGEGVVSTSSAIFPAPAVK